jgi:hypothetical protein
MIEPAVMFWGEVEELRDGVEFPHRLATLNRLVAALDSNGQQNLEYEMIDCWIITSLTCSIHEEKDFV